MKKKKERKEWTYARTQGEVDSLTFEYDPSTDSIKFAEADPKTVKSVVSYERNSGKDKVVTSTPLGTKSCALAPLSALTKTYSYLCAIDTNTKVVRGIEISICSIYHIPQMLNEYSDKYPFDHLKSYAICNVRNGINPETIGWHIFIKDHCKIDYLEKTNRTVGIIVDSELGSHDDINNQTKPYYHNHILPSRLKLIYGSADTGKEYLPNAMLTLCDKSSTMILDYLEDNDIELPIPTNGDSNFDGYVAIVPNEPPKEEDRTLFNVKK